MKIVGLVVVLALGVACGGKKPNTSTTSSDSTVKGTNAMMGGATYGGNAYGGNAYGGNAYGGKK
jgi:hypothetical protein